MPTPTATAIIGGPTDPKKPRPTVYLTIGRLRLHFTEPWKLAEWLTDHPGFPHQDILDRFLEHLDANGYAASRPDEGGSVAEALDLTTRLQAKQQAEKESA